MVNQRASNYRARYYDSNAGRFVSEDPIGFTYSTVCGGATRAYLGEETLAVGNRAAKIVRDGLAHVRQRFANA